ncbi:hypothetical protein Lfu02_73150 [Longispora fulva]|uniref:Core-binding (CB) domain-containing protein n=1 Tax=Longispora fulva TaxID=619741 RepID=A0A8J7KMD8_9ACTN|nr:site-specific integrase [Longispora fulva]MBG6133902.1 hypothetical protein [Longispora fulva]GIG62943.1 hypothetical protein Lfu02_73150 [Longispora fulva]
MEIALVDLAAEPDSSVGGGVRTWLAGIPNENTRRAYAGHLEHWLSWCAREGRDPLDASRDDVDGFFDSLRGAADPPTENTIRTRRSALTSWYTHLIDCGILADNPAASVRPTGCKVEGCPEATATGFARSTTAGTNPR